MIHPQLFALRHGKRVRERGALSAYEAIPQLKEKVEAAEVRSMRLLRPLW